MIYKKISLMLFAVLSIALIYRIPFYNSWVTAKFDHEFDRISSQTQHLKPEERMEARFGSTYDIEMGIAKMLDVKNAKNAIVLLPPRKLVSAMKIQVAGDFEVPEPAVFYYFTGYRAVWTNSKDVDSANWVLLMKKNDMAIKPIGNKQFLDTLLMLYRQFN